MARRKIHHAKSNETNDDMGAIKTLKQHSKNPKQETKSTAKSKSKEPNSQPDVGIPFESNSIINAFTSDSPTFCASEEKSSTMEPTSEGPSNTTTKNSSDISSALSIETYEHMEDHSQSASTCSNFDLESAGIESLMTNSDSQIPITIKKSRRKVTRRKTPSSICSPTPYSASTTPSPAPSPSLAQQSPSQMPNVIGVPGTNGQFICPSCNKVVDSQSEYTRHIRQHNLVEASATTHACSLCKKVLSSASSLDRHMLVHSGERPFRCHICGMAFTTNGNMHRHVRTHHDGAAASGEPSTPMQVSEDENMPNRKSRTYVKRKRLQSTLKPSARKSGPTPGIVPSKGKQHDESENCNENSVGGTPLDDEWEELNDSSVPDTSKSVSSLSLVSPHKRRCTENNNILLEKSDDASNNNWLNGSMSCDLDDSLRCLICAKTFLSKMGLQSHLDGHLPNELRCKECKDLKAFSSYQALLKHCRSSHSQTIRELRSENDAIPSDADVPLPHSATVGFHDLTFVDFSSRKFTLIAKSACEQNVRWPSSKLHVFQCHHCKNAFPSSGSLKMHVKSKHRAFKNAESLAISDHKKSILKCNRGQKTTIVSVTESTCNQCHAAFASHHQLEMHCLRHQAAEQCATPYSTVEKKNSVDMDPAAADFAPQLNKENFLALFELQSKTKDIDALPELTSLNPKHAFQNGNNNGEFEEDDSIPKLQRPNLNTPRKNLLTSVENGDHCAGPGISNTGDFADIQSMIAVTSTASALPSMMMMGSSPFTSRVASPPPLKSLASPRLADSVTTSPELPLEHNNALASSSSANRQSPTKSTSSLSSNPSSLTSSPTKSLGNEQELSLLDMENDDATDGKNLKEFACNQCPQVLPSLRALKAHNRCHLREAPYHCNVCQFVSPEKCTLMRHLRTHNGERPYMCTICQYAFTTKANCERHLRTKHGLKDKEEVRSAMRYMAFDIREGGVDGTASFASSNACPHCNLQFAQAKLLKQHLHMQHNDMYSPKPFACLRCDLRFLSQKTCLRHISKQHLDVESPEEAIGTTLTSLSSFSQSNSLSANCLKSQRGMTESQDVVANCEPARSHSADGVLAQVHTHVSDSSASTSGFVPASSILDLSSAPKGTTGRPASYPGAIHAVSEAELQDRPLDPNVSEDNNQSNLQSLVNLTTTRMNEYDIPPQDQPLDLALYPMDLSYNASPFENAFSSSSALSPIDLSASYRQASSFCSPNVSAIISPQLSILTSTHGMHSFSHNSPSPFQSRAPSSFMPAQKSSTPSGAVPFPDRQPSLQHAANRFNPRASTHLDVATYSSAYSPSGSHNIPHFSTPSGPISQPLTVSTSLSSTILSTMPSLSPPETHMMPPDAYTSPKATERSGRKRSGSSNGHGRGHLMSTSANSFLLKKQKQRRYRTERPFRCAHCAAGFTLRSNMDRHVKQQHPECWASKARGRKLVPTSTLSMVTPSISISPIHSSVVPQNITEMPQLLSSTPAFPELLHIMQAEVDPPHITFHRTEQQLPQKVPSHSLLKNDQMKVTISPKVKQAISKQIKQRKGNLELSVTAISTSLSVVPPSVTSSTNRSLTPSFADNASSLMEDESSSSESSLTIELTPVIKVAETVFPPADERTEGKAGNSPGPPPPLQLAIPAAKIVDDAEDTLPDLASVSKLLDTASQQNIQEMFRCSETVEDDANVNAVDSTKDKEALVDLFKVTHTQTKDERYLFHDGNASKFTPVPAEEALASTAAESPTKCAEKPRDGKRSAYNSAPNRVACPYCHRLFPWTSSLRRHILTHTGQKPHKCPICPLWFTTKSNCDRHLARKHNNPQQAKIGKPAMLAIFPAPGTSLVVSPATGSSSSLPDCTARNAPDRPYRCHFCLSSTFSTPKNLQKHLDSKHPGSQVPVCTSQQSPELLQGLEKTETLNETSTSDLSEGAFSSRIKMETQSDGNSNSGSEQCWGESEESGEDTAPEGSAAQPSSSRHGKPMFFCVVCLVSFAEREQCLQHVRFKHPADHAQLALNTVTDNANESDDANHEQQYIPEMTAATPVNEPDKKLVSEDNSVANIPETILHSNKIGAEDDDVKNVSGKVLDRPEVKSEASS